jgi:hypothetical protein
VEQPILGHRGPDRGNYSKGASQIGANFGMLKGPDCPVVYYSSIMLRSSNQSEAGLD